MIESSLFWFLLKIIVIVSSGIFVCKLNIWTELFFDIGIWPDSLFCICEGPFDLQITLNLLIYFRKFHEEPLYVKKTRKQSWLTKISTLNKLESPTYIPHVSCKYRNCCSTTSISKEKLTIQSSCKSDPHKFIITGHSVI